MMKQEGLYQNKVNSSLADAHSNPRVPRRVS